VLLTKTFKIGQISEVPLSLTDFRKHMTEVIEHLESPRVLMKNDTPKAVLLSYDNYVAMEEALEYISDLKLAGMAESRLSTDTFVESEDFFKDLSEDKQG